MTSPPDLLTPSLVRLPPELIDHLLDRVPPNLLQRTTLSLLQVFHEYPLSARHLWTHLIVHRATQLIPLYHKLKEEGSKPGGGMIKGVESFSQQSWKGDADILNNVLRRLPDIRVLMLNIGTNFAPEHLEEMFDEPRLGIKRMEMRFRPYVEQATYYQFLKGSYFDTAVETLYRRWPDIPSFTHLSIVQDLPPRSTVPPTAANSLVPSAAHSAVNSGANSLANSIADLSLEQLASSDSDHESGGSTPPTSISSVESKGYTGHGPFPYISEGMNYSKPKHFAQPIVFFDIKCLARFGVSAVAANLTHLRLRVPSRDLAFVLVTPQSTAGSHRTLYPSLRYLDISTTNVRLDSVFLTLLKAYARLEHLVLDRVNLFGFSAREKGAELCKDLGGACLSATLARGKERERHIAAWEVAQRAQFAHAEAERRRIRAHQMPEGPDGAEEDSNTEGDEVEDTAAARDAAAAEDERQRQLATARARRGHRSAGHSTFSIRNRSDRSSTASSGLASTSSLPLPAQEKLYMVLPPLPNMRTISVGGEGHNMSPARTAEWEYEFHAGWRDGLGKLLGWATHTADKYDRARRKAEEWHEQELKEAQATSRPTGKGKGRSKAQPAAAAVPRIKPPTDIRLYRFPLPDETWDREDLSDPTVGLIEITPETAGSREYLDLYKLAIADAELYANNHSLKPPCILCMVPDCEGPARRGAEGDRVDGRGGMQGKHRAGCGHLIGRKTWGWDGF